MITPEVFMQRWGTEDLAHYDPDLVKGLNIPDISKHFLIQAGLPRLAYVNTSFDLGSNTLVPLTDASLSQRWAYGWRKPFPESYGRYRLLGIKSFNAVGEYFDEMYISLDEQWEGKVVWIRNEPDYPVELLNNTVPQLAEMLLLIKEDGISRSTLDLQDPDEYVRYFSNLKLRLRSVDHEALKDDQGWSEMIYLLEF